MCLNEVNLNKFKNISSCNREWIDSHQIIKYDVNHKRHKGYKLIINKSLKDLGLEYIRSPCETKNQIIIIKEKLE